ncbi:MAG: hypothetical protein QME96_09755, partial [Myxococcota bacterium]|nr:hypothetical protein [Myxococcota bacterium]
GGRPLPYGTGRDRSDLTAPVVDTKLRGPPPLVAYRSAFVHHRLLSAAGAVGARCNLLIRER